MSELQIIDPADPLSLAKILPSPLSEAVSYIPQRLLVQDELTLSTLVQPSDQQKRMKIQFWEEYEAARHERRPMSISNIVFGVCTKEYLFEFIRVSRNVAWLISPKPRYNVRIAELIDRGLDKIEEVFALPITGKQAVAIANLHLAALKMLDMRKHGGYTQRIESKNLQLNKNLSDGDHHQYKPPITEKSVEELESDIKSLEQRVSSGKNQNGALLVPSLEHDDIEITPRMASGSEESIN